MPVVDLQQLTIAEQKKCSINPHEVPALPRIDVTIFKEIEECIDRIKLMQREEKEDQEKIVKLDKNNEKARETIARAEEKREILLKRSQGLSSISENSLQNIQKAVKYWTDFGIDVRQVSKETDSFDHYEFIYSKLNAKHNDVDAKDSGPKYSVGIKYHDKKLEVVSQDPELLSLEQMSELNSRLTSNYVNDEGNVDYRLAMIMIKKAVKNLTP